MTSLQVGGSKELPVWSAGLPLSLSLVASNGCCLSALSWNDAYKAVYDLFAPAFTVADTAHVAKLCKQSM